SALLAAEQLAPAALQGVDVVMVWIHCGGPGLCLEEQGDGVRPISSRRLEARLEDERQRSERGRGALHARERALGGPDQRLPSLPAGGRGGCDMGSSKSAPIIGPFVATIPVQGPLDLRTTLEEDVERLGAHPTLLVLR